VRRLCCGTSSLTLPKWARETFEHQPFEGFDRVRYKILGNRYKKMMRSMEQTLQSIKRSVEAQEHAEVASP